MLESVRAALETKSAINAREIEDIFEKGKKLRSLRQSGRADVEVVPILAAFGYECPNVNLSFFDFCAAFQREPASAPSIVAVLNVGVFALMAGPRGHLVAMPEAGHVPVFLKTGEDTLLAFLYLLNEHIVLPRVADTFREYSREFFAGVDVFRFDPDFLGWLGTDQEFRAAARAYFAGKPDGTLLELYTAARQGLGR